MKLSVLCERLSLNVVTGETEKEFCGVYACDLLSHAMSHIKVGELWITIMKNTNVIAVASLTKAAAVILVEGTDLIPDALDAAKENGITVLSTEMTAYELCVGIHELLQC